MTVLSPGQEDRRAVADRLHGGPHRAFLLLGTGERAVGGGVVEAAGARVHAVPVELALPEEGRVLALVDGHLPAHGRSVPNHETGRGDPGVRGGALRGVGADQGGDGRLGAVAARGHGHGERLRVPRPEEDEGVAGDDPARGQGDVPDDDREKRPRRPVLVGEGGTRSEVPGVVGRGHRHGGASGNARGDRLRRSLWDAADNAADNAAGGGGPGSGAAPCGTYGVPARVSRPAWPGPRRCGPANAPCPGSPGTRRAAGRPCGR